MFGVFGARFDTSMTFVSRAAANGTVAERLQLKRMLGVAQGCRTLSKRVMIHNDYLPHIDVDAQTCEVRADGELLSCEPASVLPLAQRYFLF